MNVLDIFSGIGGFSLGLERAGMRTVGFCEIDPYCRAVLRKHWPDVPIHGDIRTLADALADGRCESDEFERAGGIRSEAAGGNQGQADQRERLRAAVADLRADVICGGFPCQPFSVAGKRRGAEDDRHLWPQMLRVIQAVRPTWVIGENVAGLINMGLDGVLSDLAGAGFEVQPFVIPACAVDAPHRRDRLWIVGHSTSAGSTDYQGGNAGAECNGRGTPNHSSRNSRRSDADTDSQSPRWIAEPRQERCEWEPEPGLGRVANGVPNRVDRLRSLGNAVVPQIPEIIGRAIMKAEGLIP